jgi:hypothetical protein
MPFEIKKRRNPIIIAAVALDKDPSKATSSYAFIIIFNIRLKYRFHKIIILMDNNSEENFISQRFVKKNDLIGDSIKYIKKFIDRYAVIIYRKHDLIIYIKKSKNQK